jgi:hypothetical protein
MRLLALLILAALLLPATASARSVPKGWLGVTFDSGYVANHGSVDSEVKRMARNGVESVRVPVYWSSMQPYATAADVPPAEAGHFRDAAGVPTDFRALDRLVTSAARKRLPLLPVLLDAPGWAAADASRAIAVPRDPATFARFLTGLVGRYGVTGTFWSEHPTLPRVPTRTWQIWNEPSNSFYWDSTWASAYPRLLRAAYDAIKAADPGARVVMAGINTGGGGKAKPLYSWKVLGTLYGQLDDQGLGHPFDETAVHVYTRRVSDAVRVVRETRKVMKRHGDGRPIVVTELAWPAAYGKLRDEKGRRREFFAATTPKGMAKRLKQGVRALARQRKKLGIAGVDWFQWASGYNGTSDAFRYSGLRRGRGKHIRDTPSLAAFRSVARSLAR